MNEIERVLTRLLEEDGINLLMKTIEETAGQGDPTLGFLCGMLDATAVDVVGDTEYGKPTARGYLPGRCASRDFSVPVVGASGDLDERMAA